MTEVPLWRLYLMRAMYLLIFVGLALMMWPLLFAHPDDWPMMNSVVCAILVTVSLLSALGLRYPLQMVPLLLFELIWKVIWLLAIALPMWSDGRPFSPGYQETVVNTLVGVILVPIALPWRYLWDTYVKKPGDRWTRRREAGA